MNGASSFVAPAHPSTWLATALVVCVLGMVPPSVVVATAAVPSGDKRAAAKAEVQKAQINYKLGRFDEALEAYTRAYELFNAPALLFNIGQCHKNLKNYDRAIFFFEGYLREETKSDPRKKTLAEELIAESRAEIDKQHLAEEDEARRATAAVPRQAAPASSVAAVFGPPPVASPAAPVLVDAPSDTATTTKQPLMHKWWFWTVIGAGALAVAAGALAYYFSGPTTTVLPAGSVGTLDGR